MSFIRRVELGERHSWGYGLAWHDYSSPYKYTAPIPLNLIIAAGLAAWLAVKYPRALLFFSAHTRQLVAVTRACHRSQKHTADWQDRARLLKAELADANTRIEQLERKCDA